MRYWWTASNVEKEKEVKRTEHKVEEPFDIASVIRTVQYLDEALKRGVVVGVYEDSMEVSDEDIKKALHAVNAAIDVTIDHMEKLARSITRFQQTKNGSPRSLQ